MMFRIAALAEDRTKRVRIVCFGDSITGVYYHTGGRRAYSHMLAIALRRIYPGAKVEVINSGISGNTAEVGLGRIESDVLAHRPHLVTVMFGMNDVARIPIETYRRNLHDIAAQCLAMGAEVVLCTPNSVYPEDDSRSMEALGRFAETVREVAAAKDLPVADCWQAYEELRARDQRAWKLLLSETVHPNMNGHKVIAEEIARAITGVRVSLADVPPPLPAIPQTLARLLARKAIRATVMAPFDVLIEPALQRAFPGATVEVTRWAVAAQSLEEIEAHARDQVGWQRFQAHPDEARPHLVLLAVPPEATADSEEAFIRSYSWILNGSLSFGVREWDAVAVLPSVADPDLNRSALDRQALAREVIRGQDISFIERPAGDRSSCGQLLAHWIEEQVAGAV